MKVKMAYDDHMVESDATGLRCEDKTLAQQHFRDEVDINTIVDRFGLTGELPSNVRMPESGDFTEVFDFHSAMNAVVTAREAFETMPAKVRARFHNDAREFVDFCMVEENRPEAEKLGLVEATKLAAALAESKRVSEEAGRTEAAMKAVASSIAEMAAKKPPVAQ